MRVRVYGGRTWILGRCVKELLLIPGVVTKGDAAVSYFVNYDVYRDVPSKTIGFFTHLEEKGRIRKRFTEVSGKVDYAVSMCGHTTDALLERGVSSDRITQIYIGTDYERDEDVIFGVVGSVKRGGRKGEWLVEEMVKAGYTTVAWGSGWPCTIYSDQLEKLPMFYRLIDYLVVPSLNEGGPVPLIEALAFRKPVIAPDVGFAWEFPVIRYERGSWRSLDSVLARLVCVPTWQNWRDEHERLFRRVYATTV